jgi:hypothetical protein
MAMYYHLHLRQPNGHIEVSKSEFPSDSITIGRGTSCDIRPLGISVSLLHAEVYEDGDRLCVRDFNSVAGTKVNGKLIDNAELPLDSTLQIGDSTFRISKENDHWVLSEERAAESSTTEEEFANRVAKRLDIRTALPTMMSLSLLLILPLLVFFFFFPLLTGHRRSWNSGPISNPHQIIANDCTTCHIAPFKPVTDDGCTQCHTMTQHSEALSKSEAEKAHEALPCASCHMEHNGDDGLIVDDSALCTSCHANLKAVLPTTTTASVTSFEKHPEFNIFGDSNSPRTTETVPPLDTNPLKFNHEVHLDAELSELSKKDPLTCGSCHIPTDDSRGFLPISMENNCQSCHSLEFDERLPGVTAPHEDSDTVYRFLYSSYAGLYLDNEGKIAVKKFLRDRPGGIKDRSEEIAFYRETVKKEARSMEKELFTRLACTVCHAVRERPEPQDEAESRFTVEKPTTPTQWMPAAIFDHGTHRSASCDTCHADVTKSTSTADVLLPTHKDCTSCHHDSATASKVASSCVMCHSFHGTLPLAPGSKGISKQSHASDKMLDSVAKVVSRTESIGETGN